MECWVDAQRILKREPSAVDVVVELNALQRIALFLRQQVVDDGHFTSARLHEFTGVAMAKEVLQLTAELSDGIESKRRVGVAAVVCQSGQSDRYVLRVVVRAGLAHIRKDIPVGGVAVTCGAHQDFVERGSK